jgi:predicted secreted protein
MGDLPDQVTVRVGEELTLQLPSSASGGYRWHALVDDATVAEASTRFGDASSGHGAPTFAAYELLLLRRRSIGTKRLRCTQRRGWEAQTPSQATQSVTVHVVAAAPDEHIERKGNQ